MDFDIKPGGAYKKVVWIGWQNYFICNSLWLFETYILIE